jgi:hypothetical protein
MNGPPDGEIHSCRPTRWPGSASRCPTHSSSESGATGTKRATDGRPTVPAHGQPFAAAADEGKSRPPKPTADPCFTRNSRSVTGGPAGRHGWRLVGPQAAKGRVAGGPNGGFRGRNPGISSPIAAPPVLWPLARDARTLRVRLTLVRTPVRSGTVACASGDGRLSRFRFGVPVPDSLRFDFYGSEDLRGEPPLVHHVRRS